MAPDVYVIGRNGKPTLVKDAAVFKEVNTGGLIVLAPSIEEATHGAALLVQDQRPSFKHQPEIGVAGWVLSLGLGVLGGELIFRISHLFY